MHCRYGSEKVIPVLLRYGADPSLKTKYGCTAPSHRSSEREHRHRAVSSAEQESDCKRAGCVWLHTTPRCVFTQELPGVFASAKVRCGH